MVLTSRDIFSRGASLHLHNLSLPHLHRGVPCMRLREVRALYTDRSILRNGADARLKEIHLLPCRKRFAKGLLRGEVWAYVCHLAPPVVWWKVAARFPALLGG